MSARHVLVAALCSTLSSAPALATDGLLDPGFGANGRSYLYWGHTSPAYDYANAMAAQDNGDIVLVGNVADHVFGCNGNTTSIGVARLRWFGYFDTGFGAAETPGQILIPAGSCWRHLDARAVAVQSDGSIVIAGSVTDPFVFGGTRAAVWRLIPNGNLDPSFGNGGMATLPRAANLSPDDRANALIVSDRQHEAIGLGVVIAAGRAVDGSGVHAGEAEALVFVLEANGQPSAGAYGNWTDPDGLRYFRAQAFVSGQRVDTEFNAFSVAFDSAAGAYRYFGAGYLQDSLGRRVSTMFVLNSALGLVSASGFTFNPSGSVYDTPGIATSLVVDRTRSRVWIAGTGSPTGAATDDFGVAARTFDNQWDTATLGGYGRELVDFSVGSLAGHARANGIALQHDGRVVVGGSFYWNSFNGDARMAAVRLFDSGALDAGFGDFSASLPGVQAFQFPIGSASAESAATGIALAPHTDAIVLGGWTHNYAVPGSYYYAAAQLTDDTIFYDDFE